MQLRAMQLGVKLVWCFALIAKGDVVLTLALIPVRDTRAGAKKETGDWPACRGKSFQWFW